MTMGDALLAVFLRDVLQAWRRRADWLTTFFFFIIVVSLFPLGVGPEPAVLRVIAPGILWVAALLGFFTVHIAERHDIVALRLIRAEVRLGDPTAGDEPILGEYALGLGGRYGSSGAATLCWTLAFSA